MGLEPTQFGLNKEEELGKGFSGSRNSECKGSEVGPWLGGWGVNGGIWGLELSKQRAGRNRSLPFPLGRRGLRWDPLSGHIQLRLFDG